MDVVGARSKTSLHSSIRATELLLLQSILRLGVKSIHTDCLRFQTKQTPLTRPVAGVQCWTPQMIGEAPVIGQHGEPLHSSAWVCHLRLAGTPSLLLLKRFQPSWEAGLPRSGCVVRVSHDHVRSSPRFPLSLRLLAILRSFIRALIFLEDKNMSPQSRFDQTGKIFS